MPGTCTVTIGSDSWSVSLANTYAEIMAGLAGQASLDTSTGVLFDLGTAQYITVTTQNMLFNIDIVFIGADGIVSGISRNVSPGNLISGYGRFWLEVNAEEAANVSLGDAAVIACVGVLDMNDEPVSHWEEFMTMVVGLFTIVIMIDMGYHMIRPMWEKKK